MQERKLKMRQKCARSSGNSLVSFALAFLTFSVSSAYLPANADPSSPLHSGTAIITEQNTEEPKTYPTVTVNKPNSNGTISAKGSNALTINAAIEMVEDGGTITVYPEPIAAKKGSGSIHYKESLVIKKSMTLVAAPKSGRITIGSVKSCLKFQPKGGKGLLTVSGLTFYATGNRQDACISVLKGGELTLENTTLKRHQFDLRHGIGIKVDEKSKLDLTYSSIETFDIGISSKSKSDALDLGSKASVSTLIHNDVGIQLIGDDNNLTSHRLIGGQFFDNLIGLEILSDYQRKLIVEGGQFDGNQIGVLTSPTGFGGVITLKDTQFSNNVTAFKFGGKQIEDPVEAFIDSGTFTDNDIAFELTNSQDDVKFTLEEPVVFVRGGIGVKLGPLGPKIDLNSTDEATGLAAAMMPAIVVDVGYAQLFQGAKPRSPAEAIAQAMARAKALAEIRPKANLKRVSLKYKKKQPYIIRIDKKSSYCADQDELSSFLEEVEINGAPLLSAFRGNEKKLHKAVCKQ